MIYDPEKSTLLEGFGLTPERHNELMVQYVHGSRGDTVSRICNDEDLPLNEKCSLLLAVGTLLVGSVIDEMTEATQVLADKT